MAAPPQHKDALELYDLDDVDSSHPNTTNKHILQHSANTERIHSGRATLFAMILIAIGEGLICSIGAIVQKNGGSVLQLIWGQYLTQNLIAWTIWFCRCSPQTYTHWYGDAPHRNNIWLRGFLLFCAEFLWLRGLEVVPLGNGEAISFLSPMTTAMAARMLLGERLPSTFFVTLCVTFVGLLFICQPTFLFGDVNGRYMAMSGEGTLFLLASIVTWSAGCVLVRTAESAHWVQLQLATTTQSILVWCPLVLAVNKLWPATDGLSGGDWQFPPSRETAGVMVAIGVLGFVAMMLNVVGYQIGDATKVAWMEYMDLVFAFMYQWLWFEDAPKTWEIIGCFALFSTCLINLGEEYYHYVQAKKRSVAEELSERKPLLA